MKFDEQLDVYLRSRFTLILLVTVEEERAGQDIKAVCERTQRECLAWDVADGFQWLTASTHAAPVARDPLTALEQIEKSEPNTPALFVLKDFHEAWGNAQVKRKLRSASQRLKATRKSILILAPTSKVPEELRDEVFIVEFPLPDAAEMETVFNRLAQGFRQNRAGDLGRLQRFFTAAEQARLERAQFRREVIVRRLDDEEAVSSLQI